MFKQKLMADGCTNVNLTTQTEIQLTGSEVEYAIPARTVAIVIQASVGNIDMGTTTGFTTAKWTIFQGQSLSLDIIQEGGKSLFFNGTGTIQVATAIQDPRDF